ncbi:MAG: right-handed parallel beta-helix repeat-containing protein, partial [Bacteroidales bacterium]|nr:right-handed parallel beta-helix repeat-containing protein [Bacteroidales bacterium]
TYYNYYVKAARSTSGLRESEAGVDLGYADECGNMVEDTAYRNIWFHGSTLEITQRVFNEGPFPFLNPGQLAFTLEAAPYDGIPEYIVAYADIPPLAVNQYYDVQLAVDFDTVPYGPVPYGTWYVGCFMSWDWNNCETNFDDDYITWTDQSFVFTDAMHGTYTIGPVSCDFNGVEDALAALDSLGISDPVTFNLMPTAHNGQYTFVPVTGSEYARPIVFQTDPAFSDTAEIIFAPTAENNYTLRFSNASNIHFQNLKLSTSGFSNYQSTFGRVIEFTGNCHDIRFINCLITGFPDESHISEDNAVIYCNNSASDHLHFLNNTIRYGYMGICLEGMNLATGPLTNIEIRENTIEGFIFSGIGIKYVDNPVITGNVITAPPTLTSYHFGIDIDYLKGGCDISGNTILLYPTDWAMYGICLTDFNMDEPGQALITNNFIMLHTNVTFAYGIIATNINKTRLYNNSIHLSGIPTTFNSCIFLDCTMPAAGGYDNSLINNIFSNRLGGYALGYNENAYNYQLLVDSDHNDFFSTGPDLFFFKNSYLLQTLNQWYLETGFDLNSLNVDPAFASDFDLHSNSPHLDGMAWPLPEVPADIDGELRDAAKPDIGADEYTYVAPGYFVEINLLLEGAFNGVNMNTSLYQGGVLPLSQPYNGYPWYYSGTESVTAIPVSNVVDWVLAELRDADDASMATGATTIARQAGFLLDDGSVVSIDGIQPMLFSETINKNLYVVVRHRNHISVMSAGTPPFAGNTYTWDFTLGAGQAYGGVNAHTQLLPDAWGMTGADGNADNQINNGDKNDVWVIQAGTSGYRSGDYNLDLEVNNGDKNGVWAPNTGLGGQVPE